MKKLFLILLLTVSFLPSFAQLYIGGDGKVHSAITGGAVANSHEVTFVSDTTAFKHGFAKIGSILYYYDGSWKTLSAGVGIDTINRNTGLKTIFKATQDSLTNVTNLSLKENLSNKVNVITTPNSTDYPTTGAVNGFVASSIAGKTDTAKTRADSLALANRASQQYYGTIYEKTTQTSLSDFTQVGSVTVSASGNKLNFSGGANNFNQRLAYNYYTALDLWKMTSKVIVTQKNSTSYGVGVGIYGNNFNNFSTLDLTNTGTSGQVKLYAGNNTLTATSASNVSFSVNDTLEFSLERKLDTLISTVRNLTTNGSAITTSFNFISQSPTNAPHSTGRFSYFSIGGNFSIFNTKIFSKTPKNAAIAFVGDSKTVGFYGTTFPKTFTRKIGVYYAGINILAGGGDNTQDVINRLQEIINLKPQQVVLSIGTNDVYGFQPWQTNMPIIVNVLKAAGIEVRLINGIYDTYTNNGLYQPASKQISEWINANYDSPVVLKTYEAGKLVGNSAVWGDSVHMTQLGSDIVANTILNEYSLKGYFDNSNKNVFNGITSTAPIYIGNTSDNTPRSVDNPLLDLGATYSSTQGVYPKIKLFNTGSLFSGFGQSGGGLEYMTYSGASHLFYINGLRRFGFNTTNLTYEGRGFFNDGFKIKGAYDLNLVDLQFAHTSNIANIDAFNSTVSGGSGELRFQQYSTGAINFYGNTSILGARTFTVGTGATALGGTLATTGATFLNGGLNIKGGFPSLLNINLGVSGSDGFLDVYDPVTSNLGRQLNLNMNSRRRINLGGSTYMQSGDSLWTAGNQLNIGSSTGSVNMIVPNGSFNVYSRMAIGGLPSASNTILDLLSTTQGFGLPQMTAAQMLAISNTRSGLQVYNTTNNKIYYNNASGWRRSLDSAGTANNLLAADGSVITVGTGLSLNSGTLSATTNVFGGSISTTVTAVTTFVVTIPTQANNTYQVVITPSNSLTATLYYVTNKTTTSFDVVFTNPLTGTVAFDWTLKP